MSNADLIFELAQELGPVTTHYDRTRRIRDWMEKHHLLAAQDLQANYESLKKANDILTALLPALGAPCAYCKLTNIAECKLGFPGCSQADDILVGEDEHRRELLDHNRRLATDLNKLAQVLETTTELCEATQKEAQQARVSRHAQEEMAKQAFEKWQEQKAKLTAEYEAGMNLNAALNEQVAALTGCRDHWKISFEHERENVVRLRGLLFEEHDLYMRERGKVCDCPDCQLVRAHRAARPEPGAPTEEPPQALPSEAPRDGHVSVPWILVQEPPQWTVEDHGGEQFLVSPDGWDDGYRVDNPEVLAARINEDLRGKSAIARVWCAMCGKWGNHQSGACPELTPREPEQPWEVPSP